uniref:Uncharacterized protein LOC114330190 n=1 Tax=Diabrotica virgifera virgifera TaxID=50390 RepID=A0A6P7FGZ0_DIAVI
MKSELSPEAPIYIPPPLRNATPKSSPSSTKSSPGSNSKEPQCSRYSRKNIRSMIDNENSPRPILGNYVSTPRPILGRGENNIRKVKDDADKYIGREFRRSFKKVFKEEKSLSVVEDENMEEDECE